MNKSSDLHDIGQTIISKDSWSKFSIYIGAMKVHFRRRVIIESAGKSS